MAEQINDLMHRVMTSIVGVSSLDMNTLAARFWSRLDTADPGNYRVLASSATAVSHTGDTDETILATIPISAGLMGTTGILRIDYLWSVTNSVNNKTVRARLGGIGGTAFLSLANTTVASVRGFRNIQNRGAANSQISEWSGGLGPGSTASVVTTGAIDTSVAQDLVFTAQLASAGETITLERYLVELIIP